MPNANNILVIRNDKLGDFMLAWPAFSLLKKQYPESEITALVSPYTKDMAEICPWIDKTLLDEGKSAISLFKIINKYNYDASVALFTETKTALACFLSRIPVRVAPATKFAQLFSNKTLRQRRSQSEKPEYEYNIDLVKHLITFQGDAPLDTPAPPYLRFDQHLIENSRKLYKQENNISDNSTLIIIHPGTGGSAINLSLEQYAAIAQNITKTSNVFFIITAGPGEKEIAEKLSGLLTHTPHCTYHSTDGIVNFSKFISMCDLFISGSTGPLHIAGALNIPTAAFYPARRSATPLRWQTLNQEDRRLAISPLQHNDEYDMKTINTETSSGLILQLLSRTG